MTDEQLAIYTGIRDWPNWEEAVKQFTPKQRATFERMADFEMEWSLYQEGLGPKPTGVLIDEERRKR